MMDELTNQLLNDLLATNEHTFEVAVADMLDNLAAGINADNVAKGFWENSTHGYESKCTKIALMHTELSEAVEGLRKGEMDDKLPDHKMEHVELADCLIRIFDYCGGYNIPIGQIVMEKLAYNKSRPYKHGKKF